MARLKSTRRGVLGLFAGAPAAATSIWPKTSEGISIGLDGMGAANSGPEVQKDLLPRFTDIESFRDYVSRIAKRQAKHVHVLDPDIAMMQSWSMVAKIRKQEQRNYDRYMREVEEDFWRKLSVQGFVEWWRQH